MINTPPRRLLAHDFTFAADDEELTQYLAGAWSHLPVGNAEEAAHYSIASVGGGYRPEVDGVGGEVHTSSSRAMGMVLWRLNQGVAASVDDDWLLLHAALAVKDGRAVICSAPPDSGKSTLVSGLAERGYAYGGDEFVAVSIDGGLITPVPRPAVLEGRARALFPQLAPPLVLTWFAEQWLVDPSRFAGGIACDPAEPHLIVMPRYTRHAPVEVEELPRSAALVRVVDQAFNLRQLGRRGFHAAGDLVRRSRSVSITGGDLDAVCDAVDRLVDA